MTQKLSFEEFSYGSVYEKQFEKSLKELLISRKISVELVDSLREKIPFPHCDKDFLSFYLLKDELNGEVVKYEELFGTELMAAASLFLHNLKEMYKKILKKLYDEYYTYEKSFYKEKQLNIKGEDTMRDIDFISFYELHSNFKDTEYQFNFFKEILDGNESYWINAIETARPKDQHGQTKTYGSAATIRFTEEELIKLRDSITEILGQR